MYAAAACGGMNDAEDSDDDICPFPMEDTIFQSPSYPDEFLSKINNFREESFLSDFTIIAENQKFHVHKLVVAGSCDYFRALFSHGMKDSSANQVNLQAIPAAGVAMVLDFVYTGKVSLTLASLPDFLATASFLQVTAAITLCESFMYDKMTFENASDIISLGINFGIVKLKEKHHQMILENFMDFASTDGFLKLDAQRLIKLIENDSLRIPTEGKLLKKLLMWYEFDKKGREPVIHEVLDRVRLAQVGWPLIEYCQKTEPFVSNAKCKKIVKYAQNFMCKPERRMLYKDHRTRVRFDKHTVVALGGSFGYEIVDFVDGPDRYAIGVNNYYHREFKKWYKMGVIAVIDPRSHCPLVEFNNYGILAGGFGYADPGDVYQEERFYTNEVKVLMLDSFSLWDLCYMKEPRAFHTCTLVPGYVIAVGGKNENGALKSVERYHLESNTWKHVRPIPHRLHSHAAAAHAHKVYVTGGCKGSLDSSVSSAMLAYDAQQNEWSERPPMLQGRMQHTMTCVSGQLIVCGGRPAQNQQRSLTSVEAYDLETEQWSFLTPMRIDCCKMGATVMEEKLLIFGGENSVSDLLDTIQEYDPKTGKWGIFAHLPFPVANLAAGAFKIKPCIDGSEETDSIEDEFNASKAPLRASVDEPPHYLGEAYQLNGEYDADDDDDW